MQLISKSNKVICFSLCVIDIFSKYAWNIPLKDTKGTTITNALQKFLDVPNHRLATSKGTKVNKIWSDKSIECHNRSMASWLEINAIEMYSPKNEGKSVVTEIIIRTLKNRTYRYMTSI